MKALVIILVAFLQIIAATDPMRAQWTQTSGPYGGSIDAIISSGSYLYAGTNAGVFRSTDEGANWIACSNGLPQDLHTSILSFAVSGTNIIAGTHQGVFLSTDNGANWRSPGLTNKEIHALAASDMNVFAGTDSGVFLSTDRGQSWTPFGLAGDTILSLTASGTHVFAAVFGQGVFHTTNLDTSWTVVNNGLWNIYVVSLVSSGSKVWAGTTGGSFYYSGNYGSSWGDCSASWDGHTTVQHLAICGSNLFVGLVGFLVSNQDGGSVKRTTNDGISWTDAGLRGVTLTSLGASGSTLYAGTQGRGIYRSTDQGATWIEANAGLTNSSVRSLAVLDTNLFAGTDAGVFLRTTSNANWRLLWKIEGEVSSFAFAPPYIFAGSSSFFVHVISSTDGGTNWAIADTGMMATTVNALAVFGSDMFAATDYGVYRSSNHGSTWASAGSGSSVTALAVSDSTLFAGTVNGTVFRTTNASEWTPASAGLPNSGLNPVKALVCSGPNLFAGTRQGIFLSTNNGTNWSAVNSGFDSVNALAVSGANVFAGAADGIFLSTNSGTDWQAVNAGLPANTSVYSVALWGARVYIGTPGNGVWERPLSDIVTSVEPMTGGLPERCMLEQNWPNPFNPSTTINYTVGGNGAWGVANGEKTGAGRGKDGTGGWGLGTRKTMLVVYDVLGRQVATLVDEVKAPGSYEVRFDGSRLASGMYIYRLTTGSFVQSRTMVLVK